MVRYTFPDGAHYRVETSGIESADIFSKTAKAFKQAKIPWHKAICCVRGAGAPRKNSMMNNEILCGFYKEEELREFAKIGADYRIEYHGIDLRQAIKDSMMFMVKGRLEEQRKRDANTIRTGKKTKPK